MARSLYEAEGIDTQFLFRDGERDRRGQPSSSMPQNGENAIIVVPGACFEVTAAEVDQARALIAASSRLRRTA
jgi:ribokinase